MYDWGNHCECCEYDACRVPAGYTVVYEHSGTGALVGSARTCRAHTGAYLRDAPPFCAVLITPDG